MNAIQSMNSPEPVRTKDDDGPCMVIRFSKGVVKSATARNAMISDKRFKGDFGKSYASFALCNNSLTIATSSALANGLVIKRVTPDNWAICLSFAWPLAVSINIGIF